MTFLASESLAAARKRTLTLFLGSAAVAFLMAGCGEKSPAQNAAELERAFPVKPPNAAVAAPGSGPRSAEPDTRIQQAVSLAASALRTNGYAEAFVTLRSIQAAPQLTVDQYTAIQNARLAVEHDVAAKAAAGDPAALRALQAIKGSGH